ncbi:MAG: hypothetical protein AAF281_11220 [Pseudomonadota bacterium]
MRYAKIQAAGTALLLLSAPTAEAMFCLTAEAETFIDAPSTIVFETIVDVANYPLWNPFILAVEPAGVDITVIGAEFDLIVTGPRPGSTLRTPERTTFALPPLDAGSGGAIAYAYDAPTAPFLGNPTRVQVVTAIGTDQSFYQTAERFCGPAAQLSFLIAQTGFDAQTEALRLEAERRAANP